MNQEPVTIAVYSPQWPAQFEAEAQVLRSAFGPDVIDVDHVGSTAVPGLGAKPIIDILVGASSLAEIERHISDLEAVGYRYVPEFERQLPLRRYFVKPNRGDGLFLEAAAGDVVSHGPSWLYGRQGTIHQRSAE